MGCQMLAVLDTPEEKDAIRKLEQVPGWFDTWEQSLSRFRSSSELSALNASYGQPVPVSEIFWQVFEAAEAAEQLSGGLVTPAVLDALEEAGYDRSFDALSSARGWMPVGLAMPVAPISQVVVDRTMRTLALPGGLRLDFGGVAKGWAAHQAMLRLEKFAPALMDCGGDIAISGLMADGAPWPVAVADPFDRASILMTLKLGRCGVATSGTDHRRWRRADGWNHHIIDPRTGMPALTDIISVTVIAPSVLEAEAATKSVLILGSEEGLSWLEGNPRFSAFVVLENGQQLFSNHFEDHIWS